MKSVLWQGDFFNLNSFTVSNKQITQEMERAGVNVLRAPTDRYMELDCPHPPDVYIFHNYPYNVWDAPGRVNLFFLQYEYLRLQKKDRFLVDHLNCCFDGLIVSSEFTRKACLASGVTIPIYVCTLGYDPKAFNPEIQPDPINTSKRFRFINLGGAFERKGIDILIRAYTEEFSIHDDVCLFIKAFSYEQHLDWLRNILGQFSGKQDSPEIIFQHEESEEVGGYYVACDVGVFPYRGEGFGLPILEALACGLPVIVTQGGSTDDFCNQDNSYKINAAMRSRADRHYLEPDLVHLRTLMRASLQIKKTAKSAQRISSSVASLTWESSAQRMIEIIEQAEDINKRSFFSPAVNRSQPSVTLISEERFLSEEIRVWSTLSDELKTAGLKVQTIYFRQPLSGRSLGEFIVARAGFALEYFSQAGNDTRRVLLFDHYPVERSAAIDQLERAEVGVEADLAPSYTPMEIWRKKMELSLADVIVVYDSISQQFLTTHFPGKKIERVSPPLSALLEPQFGGPEEPMRFLFWGSSPFQRGISQLFEAWNALKPHDAELICLMDSQLFLTSHQLISQLVANPSISPYNLLEIADPMPLIHQCDVQILPAVEDGFFEPMARQMACGKPAIVSDRSGMKDLVIPERTGLVYPSGDLEELIGCIRFYLERKTSMLEIKRNCHQSMQNYSYRRFADEMLALLKGEP